MGLSFFFAFLILYACAVAFFCDILCYCFEQQDESEENENSTGIEMHKF